MWSSLFVATHLLISSQALRPRLINLIGGERYRVLYSLLAIAILAPMIIVFARHKHAGRMLWYLRDFGPARLLTWLLMFAALIILTAGIIDPSPSSMVAPRGRQCQGRSWRAQAYPPSGFRRVQPVRLRTLADEWMGG